VLSAGTRSMRCLPGRESFCISGASKMIVYSELIVRIMRRLYALSLSLSLSLGPMHRLARITFQRGRSGGGSTVIRRKQDEIPRGFIRVLAYFSRK